MAYDGINDEIVTKFLLNTCGLCQMLNLDALRALMSCARAATDDDGVSRVPLTTGSVAEFYIQPMLSCVGDVDIMYHLSDLLAIPAGAAPPTELPGEFDSRVEVYEVIDCEFPGYVYLVLSYLLTEYTQNGIYNAQQCRREFRTHDRDLTRFGYTVHGPAVVSDFLCLNPKLQPIFRRVTGSTLGLRFCSDAVYCIRCLSWPSQAADWPTRCRKCEWPDSATVHRVVSNGSDMVQVAHVKCRQDQWMWRLSFSRAEIALINSWMPVQQIVYHILRCFMKIELPTTADQTGTKILSNYNVKTLMMWACELKPRRWWTNDLKIVRIGVELLHTLGIWLTDARCRHYFISNCNLFDHPNNSYCSQLIASRLTSETEASFVEWFIKCYIRKCAQLCPGNVSHLFDYVSSRTELENAVSQVVDWRLNMTLVQSRATFIGSQGFILLYVSHYSLTVNSCLCLITGLTKIGPHLLQYFTAATFLHVACKTRMMSLRDELLHVLAALCLSRQPNDVRLYVNARRRHGSVLSLSQAAKLMKVIANSSRSTVQLIEIELSKAYLYRALRCKDSDSDSIYCLANVYLAALYYTTGQYQTAIDHCTLVMGSQDHSQCSFSVVQGELLPRIDNSTDSVLGLAVFYQYVRIAALNIQQQKCVDVFTTELFAHYLHVRCLSVWNCHFSHPSAAGMQQYRKYLYEKSELYIADVLLFDLENRTGCQAYDQKKLIHRRQTKAVRTHHLDTTELVELLQQYAIEHLTKFRQLEAQEFGSADAIATTDFEAVYAYKRGDYQHCLQLSTENVRTLMGRQRLLCIHAFPEFIQLMDGDIVSLLGLTLLVNPLYRADFVRVLNRVTIFQLSLSLYLMTQCQMKLHHSVTSLAQTLDYVKEERRILGNRYPFSQQLMRLTEYRILRYISR